MKSTLNSLKYLAEQNNFSDPFENQEITKKESNQPNPFKKLKRNSRDDFVSDTRTKLDKYRDKEDLEYECFDDLVQDIDEFDEDADLRNSILSMGRKYARDYSASGDNNEVTKAFAPQEAHLNDLLASVARETARLEEDIDEMRKMRSRNYGKLSDMIEVKGSLYSNQLQIIKEINAVKKTQFEIKNKLKEAHGDDSGSYAAQSVVQSIFGLGHDTLLNGVGGRDGSSGAYSDDRSDDESYEDSEDYGELITSTDTDSDGAKFLKYEGRGVHYVLEETQDGERTVYAEDSEGNVVEDYPVPNDISELRFEINQKNNTAIDQLQRKYEYRYI